MANGPKLPDLYEVLGIKPDAPQDEIKKQYRKIASENHPDAIGQINDEDERQKRVERFRKANEAYEILSDNERRRKYDESVRLSNTARGAEGDSVFDLFNQVFGSNSIFGGGRFEGSGFGTQGTRRFTRTKYGDHFLLSDTDMALLVALKRAYEAKSDGKWRVRKGEDDKRDWMPDEVFSVQREGKNVYVFRVITDWRSKEQRDKPIKVRNAEKTWEFDKSKTIEPGTFLGQWYLYGKGRDLLEHSWEIPSGYGKYLNAMARLAQKFAQKETNSEGNYDIADELRIINDFNGARPINTRIEGDSLWADDQDREWIRKVPLKEFWKRFNESEGRVVRVEGGRRSKEGGTKSSTHSESSSGENLG